MLFFIHLVIETEPQSIGITVLLGPLKPMCAPVKVEPNPSSATLAWHDRTDARRVRLEGFLFHD